MRRKRKLGLHGLIRTDQRVAPRGPATSIGGLLAPRLTRRGWGGTITPPRFHCAALLSASTGPGPLGKPCGTAAETPIEMWWRGLLSPDKHPGISEKLEFSGYGILP